MMEIQKTSCDFAFLGFPDPDVPGHLDGDTPKRARPQKVWIDLEEHADYLEEPRWVGRSSITPMKVCSGISLSSAMMIGISPR